MNVHLIGFGAVRTCDPEAKRQRLFEAALTEFATYGVAGARVDRLAKRAGISPGLVYSFYESKERLFDAVFERIVDLAVSTVPIDADHLPEYAARLYDAGLQHPEVARFMTWYHLERGEAAMPDVVIASMGQKVATIKDRAATRHRHRRHARRADPRLGARHRQHVEPTRRRPGLSGGQDQAPQGRHRHGDPPGPAMTSAAGTQSTYVPRSVGRALRPVWKIGHPTSVRH